MDRPRRVLVVDDDADMRAMLADALELEGYRVVAAGDGATALELVAAAPPDLIVLDMVMPGLSGPDVAEALKHGGIGVPILALSAGEDPEAAAEEIGAADWLAKPFDVLDLVEKVARLCPPA